MPHSEERKLLGSFLVARRALLKPAEFGLTEGRRRALGLRREEVALLAGVSVSWYTWLEQGRDIRASANTLQRVAKVLRLDRAEFNHLFALSSKEPPPYDEGTELTEGLHLLLRALGPIPAYIRNSRLDILAWNPAITELFVDYGSLPAGERNTLRLIFLYEPYRKLIVDWEQVARDTLETFRAARARARDKTPFDRLASELSSRSKEFEAWWPSHEVQSFSEGTKRIRHANLGVVAFSYVALTPQGRPGLSLVTFVPVPCEETNTPLHPS